MRIVRPDPDRRIDLPGVGPVPRPVDIDQGVSGFARLKSLRVYDFAPGIVVNGESEGDEVFVLPLSGRIDLTVAGARQIHAQVTAGGTPAAFYMEPRHAYRLVPQNAARVAYVRAEAVGQVASQPIPGIAAMDVAEILTFELIDLGGSWLSPAGAERFVHLIAGAATLDETSLHPGDTALLPPDAEAALTGEARLAVFSTR